MDSPEALTTTHPPGEGQPKATAAGLSAQDEPLLVDTPGGRYHVRWDDSAPATPFGKDPPPTARVIAEAFAHG